tara:strand:+ start:386 stop:2383 length:1998 start_codon:yes stop_codon:yes gene_type:complete
MSVTFDHKLKTQLAKNFVDQFGPEGEDKYFLAISKITGNSHTINSEEEELKTRKGMVLAKRILQNDAALIVPRYDWSSGITMSRLDSSIDMTTATNPFYVVTPSSNFRNVYICLENNESELSASLYEPIGNSTDPIVLPDGFKWKFLYTISDELIKFKDENYIPVKTLPFYENLPDAYADSFKQNQYAVQYTGRTSSETGSIQSISITEKTGSYTYTIPGSSGREIQSVPNTTRVELDLGGDSPSTVGYAIRFLTGDAAGTIRTLSSFDNGSFVLDSAYEAGKIPSAGDKYEIGIPITLTGDGSGAKAFAKVNSDQELSRVIVYEKGANYSSAVAIINQNLLSGVVRAGSAAPTESLNVTVSSPIGSDPEFELLATRAALGVKYSAEENQGILGNDFRDVIILKNPELPQDSLNAGNLAGFDDDTITRLELTTTAATTNFTTLKENLNIDSSESVVLVGSESKNTALVSGGQRGLVQSINADNVTASVDVLNLRKPFKENENLNVLKSDGTSFTQLDETLSVSTSRFGDSAVQNTKDYFTCTTALRINTNIAGDFTPQFDGFVVGASLSDAQISRFRRDNVEGNKNTLFITNISNKSGSTFGFVKDETVSFYSPVQGATVSAEVEKIEGSELDVFSGETLYIKGLTTPVTRVFEQEEFFKFIFEF